MQYYTLLVVLLLAGISLGNASERSGNHSCQIRRKRSFLIEKTACYEELGCFSTGPPFYHPIHRPISVLPQPRNVVNTMFQLFTRRNKNRPIFLSAGNFKLLLKTPFDPRAVTRMIVHGLNDNLFFTTWVKKLKDTFLHRADDNILVVDWSGSNRLPYSISVANSRLVGAEIALLITFLQKAVGAQPENFHIIGHSLGAHIAGYAGERLNHLGRITGLDPAGPFFRNVPDKVKLDRSDALFVDIIHSDPGITVLQGFGSSEDAGHLDFYPGGGDPPGCEQTVFRSTLEDLPTEALSNTLACQHLRSIEFFQYSFNQNGCLFIGVECPSWISYNRGECDCGLNGENCAVMGVFSPTYTEVSTYQSPDRILFLRVAPERPYCVHQYQIAIYVRSWASRSFGYEESYVDIEARGNLEILKGRLKLKINKLQKSTVSRFLLSTDRHIGEVESVSVGMAEHYHDPAQFYTSHVTIKRVRITYIFPLPRHLNSGDFCLSSERPSNNYRKSMFSQSACD